MFGKMISEETETKISSAVRVATYAKAIEAMTASLANLEKVTGQGDLQSELRETLRSLHEEMKGSMKS